MQFTMVTLTIGVNCFSFYPDLDVEQVKIIIITITHNKEIPKRLMQSL